MVYFLLGNIVYKRKEKKENEAPIEQDINEVKLQNWDETIKPSQRSNKRKKKRACILVLPDIYLIEEEIDFSASSRIGVESGQ